MVSVQHVARLDAGGQDPAITGNDSHQFDAGQGVCGFTFSQFAETSVSIVKTDETQRTRKEIYEHNQRQSNSGAVSYTHLDVYKRQH